MPSALARYTWMYAAIAAGSITATVWLAHRSDLGVSAALIALLPNLGSVFHGWVTLKTGERVPTLDEVTERLATEVRRQWEKEYGLRGDNDPYPLSVAWRAASEALADPVGALRTQVAGWPVRPASDPDGWADEPGHLTGEGAQIADLLIRRIATRRLVVLGAPGAGKTTLLISLVLALLDERERAGKEEGPPPVPVLVPLASWNPLQEDQDLFTWLAGRLATDYRGLENRVPDGTERTRARVLLDTHRVLPVLDGFDELPDAVRATALDRVSRQLLPGQGLVLSSRTAEYRAVTDPPAGLPVRLAGAAGIELLPLTPGTVAAYLRRAAGGVGTDSAARWEPVIGALGTGLPVARALSTPLTVSLAGRVYNPRPGEGITALPDPATLCDTGLLPDADAVRVHLYDAFIPSAYRPHPDRPARWSPGRAGEALGLLARNLQDNLRGTTDLAWWELRRAAPGPLPRLAVEAVGGLLLGLGALCLVQGVLQTLLGDAGLPPWAAVTGVTLFVLGNALVGRLYGPLRTALGGRAPGWIWDVHWLAAGVLGWVLAWPALGRERGLLVGVVCGLLTGLTFGPPGSGPAVRIRWAWSWGGVAIGLTGGLGATVAFGPAIGLPIGGLCGLTFGVTNGWRAGSADIATAVGPRTLLAQDRRIFFRLIGVVGGAGTVTGGVLGGLVHEAADDPARGVVFAVVVSALAGAGIGTAVGLVPAWGQGAWGAFTVARCYLTLRHRLPFRLMDFLADAHERRGVLRQAGAFYQFRHIGVQRRVASRGRPGGPVG
ncbi:NACHT domain-containing protein [Streptomyces sp. NBC_01803]|uniref:NACHT domain-containing protein n=1 Tax=Streptomyces sp. NBC_01803 TaxID=2975946 RepID=UPI002DDB170F|nr:NACHT domain-containing protein [Streptomyces sp. NBC_01803]WSA44108.1 NACHT domain-containing protein [Streptomyces sp. NBC_01803]